MLVTAASLYQVDVTFTDSQRARGAVATGQCAAVPDMPCAGFLTGAGFLTTPHIGCYSHEDYTPFLPIVCISVPVVDLVRQLPSSVVDVLRVVLQRGMIGQPGQPNQSIESSLDLYAIIHSGWQPATCQHFQCERRDEANLLYHPWTFAGDDVEGIANGDDIAAGLFCGLFEPWRVEPCHLDRQGEDGCPFNRLSKRITVAHGGRFSPNNNNFRLVGPGREGDVSKYLKKGAKHQPGDSATGGGDDDSTASAAAGAAGAPDSNLHPSSSTDAAQGGDSEAAAGAAFPTFISFAVDPQIRRGVIAIHCIPLGNDDHGPADRIRAVTKKCKSLGQVMNGLEPLVPQFMGHLKRMVEPALGPLAPASGS